MARGDLASGIKEGDEVAVTFDPAQVHLFDANGNALTQTADSGERMYSLPFRLAFSQVDVTVRAFR